MNFSTSWQIWVFLAVGLLVLAGLAAIALKYKKDNYLGDSWLYFTAFVLLGGLAMFTARNYVYPDSKIFNNAAYHVLEHQGFEFNKNVALVNAIYPEESLWDNKSGSVVLSKDSNNVQIEIKNYYEPFYLSSGKESKYFKLQNNIFDGNVSEGFTLLKGTDTVLQLKIIPFKEDDRQSCYYLAKTRGNVNFDTSSFTQPVHRGYPLIDILLSTPGVQLSDEIRPLLDEALLIRDSIGIENSRFASEKIDKNTSALRFFPKSIFYIDPRFSIAGVARHDPDTAFKISAQDGALFYSGIGFSKTDVFRLDLLGGDRIRLSYLLPKMQQLRDEEADNQLFITSSVEEVQHHDLKGGYLFNVFEMRKNINNVNATVRYIVGSPAEAMFFKIKDLYSTAGGSYIYPADTAIHLKSLNTGNGLTWMIQFHNLRESNPLQLKHINWFIGIFLLLLAVRIYIDTRRISIPLSIANPFQQLERLGSLTPIELAIYVVIFCFSVVRLILAWRMSTFVPIEDIDAARFYKLRNGYSVYQWSLLIIVIAFFLLYIVKMIYNSDALKNRVEGWWLKRTSRLSKIAATSPQVRLLALFVLTLLFLVLVSKLLPGTLERLFNIPLPTLAYFVFDLLLLKSLNDEYIPDVTPPRMLGLYKFIYLNYAKILLWFIAFLYLAYQDSGFSIIFLLYGIIHHVFSKYFFDDPRFRNKLWVYWVYIVLITVAFVGFLYWQSELLLSAFKNTWFWTTAVAVVLFIVAFLIGSNLYFQYRVGRRGLYTRHIVSLVCIVMGIVLILSSGKLSSLLNDNKSYLRYRAEIQLPDFNIEDLIESNQFKSSDITYILRSAHNQWFINLYNNSKPNKYFTLQPHFNQGSSFTTQTTDLVVTRYLLAEHPVSVTMLLMLMLLMLPLIYALSMNMKDSKINFSIFGIFILLFSIAFFVYLSATNRVVFFGQDFPFISLTSKIAVAFPILIFLIAIIHSWHEHENAYTMREDVEPPQKGMFIIAVLVLTLSSIALLRPKNKEKEESHFNISALIDKTARTVESINDEFNNFQENNKEAIENIPIDSLIRLYTLEADQSRKFQRALTDTTGNKFLASLLTHFSNPLTNRWDPNELLHIRKRNAYYNMIVNRKYYFIPSFKEEQQEWKGNLLAAKKENMLGFLNRSNKLFIPDTRGSAIIPNILDVPANKNVPELKQYRDSLNNIFIMRIDPSFSENDQALYLIKSGLADYAENKANFHIYNDTLTIHGNHKYPAIRLLPGDLLEMDVFLGRNSKTVIKWSIVEKNEDYLAKNLWLNGRQSLYYPLGKELMWSYNFANLIKEAKHDSINVRVSIDYDLSKEIYNIIDDENKGKLVLSDIIRENLIQFRDLDFTVKKQVANPSEIYIADNKIQVSENSRHRDNANLKAAIAYINKRFHATNTEDYSNNANLVSIINEATEKKFDYSAVVLDGYGRIRSISDYGRFTKTDPNNIKDLNRFLGNLYKQSSVSTEKDFFGNKSLLHIIPGPGSSFKPMAFTAVSSRIKFGWEDLRIENVNPTNVIRPVPRSRKNKTGVAFYGGKKFLSMGEPFWNLETYNLYGEGLTANKYIVHSNNLYHSAVIFLGSQSENTLRAMRDKDRYEPLFKDISNSGARDSSTFPVFIYKNRSLVLDPDNWLQKSDYFGSDVSVLATGLQENFNLAQTRLGISDTAYFNSFGNDSVYSSLFQAGRSAKFIWSYPELSTFNQLDRTVRPAIRNGLIQPSLGSFPLKITPIEMAAMGMRLASLNREDYITTFQPDSNPKKAYKFFNLSDDWDTTSFIRNHQQQVMKQLFEVINGDGTARALRPKLAKYIAKGYHFYSKTGTINRKDDSDDRGKHLLVIITNRRIDDTSQPLTVSDLKQLRYYVIFMSYHGINKDEFDIGNFYKIISATMESDLFINYMSKGL